MDQTGVVNFFVWSGDLNARSILCWPLALQARALQLLVAYANDRQIYHKVIEDDKDMIC